MRRKTKVGAIAANLLESRRAVANGLAQRYRIRHKVAPEFLAHQLTPLRLYDRRLELSCVTGPSLELLGQTYGDVSTREVGKNHFQRLRRVRRKRVDCRKVYWVEVRVGDRQGREPMLRKTPGNIAKYALERCRADRNRALEARRKPCGCILKRGCDNYFVSLDAQQLGAGSRHCLADDYVGRQRKVGAVGFDGSDRQDDNSVRAVEVANLFPRHAGQVPHRHDISPPMTFVPPESFNIADYFLDARIQEGKAENTAIITDDGTQSYGATRDAANRFANVLFAAGVRPEERIIIALPDSAEYVAAFFGILKVGAVVVMVNPDLPPDAIEYFCKYTCARTAIVTGAVAPAFRDQQVSSRLDQVLVLDNPGFQKRLATASVDFDNVVTHRDDPAIWLFSGGTTGRPKAVVQTHRSFANSTECYARNVIGYSEDDRTLSVPKLYFGYATGSNLLFPFSVGASTILFPERCTAEGLFDKIRTHRPTILINVPTMVNKMVNYGDASRQDLSSLRLTTSAGEALPEELFHRWQEAFGVELLDGLGTAEMWHIFISNPPGGAKPGTIGTAVPGFDVQVRDNEGRVVPDGQTGWLWVSGDSRAIGYWQQMEKTKQAFRGDWYVSGDLVERDSDGYFQYRGRADDLLKVGGKWLAPQEVEGCLLEHDRVREVAVIGMVDADGLTKPHAFVVAVRPDDALAEELQAYCRARLESYKHPRKVIFRDTLPRTHLGKVDRAQLRA